MSATTETTTEYEPDEIKSRVDGSSSNKESNSETVVSCGCRHRNYVLNGCVEYLAYIERSTHECGCTAEKAHVCEETIVTTGADGEEEETPADDDALGNLLNGTLEGDLSICYPALPRRS